MTYHVWIVKTVDGNMTMLSDECDTVEKAESSLRERFQRRFISVRARGEISTACPVTLVSSGGFKIWQK